jgi:1-acyl-sn-glycerol-3-phosphate acyltransferase
MKAGQETAPKTKTYTLEMNWWYRLVRTVVGIALRLLSRFEVEGLDYVPDQGPYIVAVNHLHWMDAPALGVAFPHKAYVFVAEKWGEHWMLGPLFVSVDAIFVRRGEVDRQALREAVAVLKGGAVLGMAPEGTRSRTGGLQEGRSGAAYLAYRVGVPVVPVAIAGQDKVFSSLRRLRRARVQAVFGPAFAPPPVEGKASGAEIHAFSEEIMYHISALLPAEYRGVYSDVAEKRPSLVAQYATGNGTSSTTRS